MSNIIRSIVCEVNNGPDEDSGFKSGFPTEPDTDIQRQMTAADNNNYLLWAVVRNVLRHLSPPQTTRLRPAPSSS